jgi:hypothetical protein
MVAPRTVESTGAANHGEHQDLTQAHLTAPRPTVPTEGAGDDDED